MQSPTQMMLQIQLWASWFKRRIFFIFSYCMTMGDDDPRGVANLDPRGMIGRIYVEYHLTLLHTKHTRFMPFGIREDL